MSNHHTLTKRVEPGELIPELVAGGVTYAVSIDSEKIMLRGDAAGMAAQLAFVATVEAAHTPTTVSEATLTAAPHIGKLLEELNAVAGVTNVGIEHPASYPGTVVITHNSLDGTQQANLIAAAVAHDASTVPSLSVDTAFQVIAADNLATGTVEVADSRGAGADGKTVKLRIPQGGSAGANADSFVLDATGKATATFQATTILTDELVFEFYYASGEADSAKFTIRRGTP